MDYDSVACREWHDSLGKSAQEVAGTLATGNHANPPSYPYALGVAQAVIADLLRQLQFAKGREDMLVKRITDMEGDMAG